MNYNWCSPNEVIVNGKERINYRDTVGLKELLQEVLEKEEISYSVNYGNIYNKLFLHSCVKGNTESIIFMVNVYFDILRLCDQLALRQTVFYGKQILPKTNKELILWYDSFVIPIFRL